MPGWGTVLAQIEKKRAEGGAAVDLIRRSYLARLHRYTKRNVIAYYSGWLNKPANTPNLDIGDDDKNAFMTAVHGLDRKAGLDLILHTPGGNIAATESLVDYLWKMFDKDIRVIVPQLAMSAGTMIACSAKSIVMGKQSNLGPIDPQFGGVAAQAVIEEFEMAVRSVKAEPASAPLWQSIIGKYHPTFLLECMQAIDWSREMVQSWLTQNMFAGMDEAEQRAKEAVAQLSDHAGTKTHSRHLSLATCKTLKLNIEPLEDDKQLQDLVLTVHHAFMHTFAQTVAIKIVENHKGAATILMERLPQGRPIRPSGLADLMAPLPQPPVLPPVVPQDPPAQPPQKASAT